MSSLDIILGGILLVAFFLGFRKGLLASLVSFLMIFIAGYVAIYYSSELKPYMQWLGEQEDMVYQIAAFILCFLMVSIVLWFLSKLLTNFANILSLGVVNRLLGGTFNVLKYAFLLSLAIFSLNALGKEIAWKTEESYLFAPIASIAPSLIPLVSDYLEEMNTEALQNPDS